MEVSWARPGILKGTWVGGVGTEGHLGPGGGGTWMLLVTTVGHTAASLGKFRAERLGLLHISVSYAAMNENSIYKLALLVPRGAALGGPGPQA